LYKNSSLGSNIKIILLANGQKFIDDMISYCLFDINLQDGGFTNFVLLQDPKVFSDSLQRSK